MKSEQNGDHFFLDWMNRSWSSLLIQKFCWHDDTSPGTLLPIWLMMFPSWLKYRWKFDCLLGQNVIIGWLKILHIAWQLCYCGMCNNMWCYGGFEWNYSGTISILFKLRLVAASQWHCTGPCPWLNTSLISVRQRVEIKWCYVLSYYQNWWYFYDFVLNNRFHQWMSGMLRTHKGTWQWRWEMHTQLHHKGNGN